MSSFLFTPWSPQAERDILQRTLQILPDVMLQPHNRFYISAAVNERLYHLDHQDIMAHASYPSYVDAWCDDMHDLEATKAFWSSLMRNSPHLKNTAKQLNSLLYEVARLQDWAKSRRAPMDWRNLIPKKNGIPADWFAVLSLYGILSPLVLSLVGVHVAGTPKRMIPKSVHARMSWFPPHVYGQRATLPCLITYWHTICGCFPGEIDEYGVIRGRLTMDDLFMVYMRGIPDCLSSYDNRVPNRQHIRIPFGDTCECRRRRALHWMLGMERGGPGPITPSPTPSPPRPPRSSLASRIARVVRR